MDVEIYRDALFILASIVMRKSRLMHLAIWPTWRNVGFGIADER